MGCRLHKKVCCTFKLGLEQYTGLILFNYAFFLQSRYLVRCGVKKKRKKIGHGGYSQPDLISEIGYFFSFEK